MKRMQFDIGKIFFWCTVYWKHTRGLHWKFTPTSIIIKQKDHFNAESANHQLPFICDNVDWIIVRIDIILLTTANVPSFDSRFLSFTLQKSDISSIQMPISAHYMTKVPYTYFHASMSKNIIHYKLRPSLVNWSLSFLTPTFSMSSKCDQTWWYK